MAVKNIECNKLAQNTAAVIELVAATTANDGVAIDFTEQDSKTVILVKNDGSSEQTFTVKQGDGIQGVADYIGTVGAGKTAVINLESGRFKKLYGENKGKVLIIPSSTDLKFAAAVMP